MLDLTDKTPIYHQIMTKIRKDIASGRISPGDKLASIREMSQSFKVNPNTVQRAYQEMEREGITTSQRGTGVFITDSKEKIKELQQELSKEYLKSFTDSMLSIGFELDEILIILNEYIKTLKEEQ